MSNCRFTKNEISDICRELSFLLHAGGNSADTLDLLSQQQERGDVKKLLRKMANDIDDGYSLDGVFKNVGCFPNYMCALLSVGVRTGRTEETLYALADYYDDRADLERKIASALVYPAILLIIMLVVVVVLLVKVLPIFDSVYAELGGSLTGIAGGLLSAGRLLGSIMPLLCIVLGAAVILIALFALSGDFREKALGIWREKMGNRGICAKMNSAHLAQSLAMCMSSGLPFDEALELSADLLGDIPDAKAQIKECISRLENGERMAQVLSDTRLLPPAQCRMLELGIKSGASDAVMHRIAKRLDSDAEASLQERIGQVEPTLVLVTSILLGMILLSAMLPLMHIMSAIG